MPNEPLHSDELTALLPLKDHHPRFMREAIDSLFAQTSPEWRLIIIVEPADLAAYEALLAADLRDPRVRIVSNNGRRLAGAFNTGMRAADTAFVAILLGDDMWAPGAVRALRQAIAAYPEVDFFHSGREIVDGSGQILAAAALPADGFTAEDFIDSPPVKHLLCWRTSFALENGGMDESLDSVGPDDYDFPWTMLERGAVFRAIPERLYKYRDHRDAYRLTTHLPLAVHLRGLRRILEKHGVPRYRIRRRLRRAKRTFLRQCLYRNELHRRLSELLGWQPRRFWRQKYT
jgi:glycosyltransferase involved in cell wall biosynthesis